MKKNSIILLYFIVLQASAQNSALLKGRFSGAKEIEIRLMGFIGTKDTLLAQTKTDASGNFQLNYPKEYIGAANLQVKEMTSLIVLLNNENFEITWANFKDFTGVQFTKSKENEVFQDAYTINMDAQKKNMELAEKVFQTARKKYEQGLGSTFEVLLSDTEWQRAQGSYFESLYNAVQARINYRKATGRLAE
jgi:hypothetical protein